MGDIDPISVWRSWFSPRQLAHPASPAGRGGSSHGRTPGPLRQATSHPPSHGLAWWYDEFDHFAVERMKHYLGCLTIRESKWKFVTSAGGDISVGTPTAHLGVNVTGGALWFKEGDGGKPVECIYGGVGGSVSLNAVPFPGNFSFSMPQMPSYGVVYELPYAGKTLSLTELTGAFVLFVGAADAGVGWSGSLMFIGGSPGVAGTVGALTANLGYIAALLATSNACVRFHGMGATVLPYNIGVNAYVGAIGVAK